MSFLDHDGGQVEPGRFRVRVSAQCDGDGAFGGFQVADLEVVCGEDVGDVGDGADHVLVGPVPFDEPGPSGRSELVEWSTAHQL